MSNPALNALLELQHQDSTVAQLRHRREHLAPRQQVAANLKEAGELKQQLDDATKDRDVVSNRVKAIASEVDSVDQRIKSINGRLYGSAPISPKDAQAMTEEVKHLGDRKSGLEDGELEQMELLEPKQLKVDGFESMARELGLRLHAAQQELLAAETEIDVQLDRENAQRAELARRVDQSLLTKYESLRSKLDGVAVAAIEDGRCGGCHLSLSAAELSRVHKAGDDELVYCEECGRILVRP